MNEAALVNSPEITVSELSASLKRTLETTYDHVRVRGELGKVTYHSNGHVYFDLKDEGASLAGVIWRSAAVRLRFRLETGLEVVATGRITTYAGRSQYQLIAEAVEPAGAGALMALLEERKRKLAAEGLFEASRKRALPFLPNVIGVITSPTGAVIRDILHRLRDRFPRRVVLWPVRVQGEGAAGEVAAAINGFNAIQAGSRIARPDVIIVARGGGSLEDLWAFNEEIVARAAAASKIPLISAVGHETDTTLIDYVSDRRAPTPTAAAEMAVPVRGELLTQVGTLAQRSWSCWSQRQERRRADLRGLARALPSGDRLLGERRQRADVASQQLLRCLRAHTQTHRAKFQRWDARLGAQAPQLRVQRLRERFAELSGRLGAGLGANRAAHAARLSRERMGLATLHARLAPAFAQFWDRKAAAVDKAAGLLSALSYHGVLERGFALVRDSEGKPIRSAKAVSHAMRLDVEFADGRVAAVAGEKALAEPPAPRPRRRRSAAPDSNQGSLF